MNNNKFCLSIILISVFITSCKSQLVYYRVPDSYKGPCAVFITSKKQENSNIVNIDKGLGVIGKKVMDNRFIFQSQETNNEISIIPIGKEEQAEEGMRYIFRLTKDVITSECSLQNISKVSFFIGNKSEYLAWRKQYKNELDYFSSIGLDWCKYYKELEYN